MTTNQVLGISYVIETAPPTRITTNTETQAPARAAGGWVIG